jgi:D-alanyl-D-alanine carboxypeptidase
MHLMEQHPQVFDILSQEELPLYTREGKFHHTIRNTNILLHYSEWPARIFGGKTGSTPLAKESLIMLLESPDYKGYIVNVVLGSQDRFLEMRTLLGWILQSYQWQT